MSDEWNYFPCQMGDHQAWILYDHGIRDSIDAIAPQHLLKVRATLKQQQPDGTPSNEEFHHLKALEDDLQAMVPPGDLYVGRVTVQGNRHFYIYTSDSPDAWRPRLDGLGERHGYALASVLREDDRRTGYWQELFPTEDDWQVIKDLAVIEALERDGDNGASQRRIDHWSYFPSRVAAEQFAKWAGEHGYASPSIDADEGGRFCVRVWHNGTLKLGDITSHTVAMRREASQLGGEYDGWETPVCKTS